MLRISFPKFPLLNYNPVGRLDGRGRPDKSATGVTKAPPRETIFDSIGRFRGVTQREIRVD